MVLLVGMLYKMCKTQLIIRGEGKNEVNEDEIKTVIDEASLVIDNVGKIN